MKSQDTYTDLVTLFERSVERFSDNRLFGVPEENGYRWISYGEVAERAAALRTALAARGVGPGDRVAVISANRPEWAVGAYATYGRRAAYVAMYENQRPEEWAYILRDSGARLCFVGRPEIQAKVVELSREIPTLDHVICFDSDAGDPDSLPALLQEGAARPVLALRPEPTDIATFIYTSGTTGNPKGVCLTHCNVASNVGAVRGVLPWSESDVSLAFLPWAHVFGGSIELHGAVSVGAGLALVESVEQIVPALSKVRPTLLFAVPRVWNQLHGALVSGKIEPKHLGGRLRHAVSGAAALSPKVIAYFEELGVTILEGYGLTESSGVTCVNRPGTRKIGSVGQTIAGVRVELDHEVPGGDKENGEILIYGHGVMVGYHGRPDVTDEALTQDGGLRSGDLGCLDADGFLYITGRVKDLYKLENGKYVAPVPLEEQLVLSPFIAQAIVSGEDRPRNVALIVPDFAGLDAWAGTEGLGLLQREELLTHPRVRALYAAEIKRQSTAFKRYEHIENFALVGEEFTTQNGLLTPTLKLKRREARRRYGALLARLYQEPSDAHAGVQNDEDAPLAAVQGE